MRGNEETPDRLAPRGQRSPLAVSIFYYTWLLLVFRTTGGPLLLAGAGHNAALGTYLPLTYLLGILLRLIYNIYKYVKTARGLFCLLIVCKISLIYLYNKLS